MKCPHYAGGIRRMCPICHCADEEALETQRAWSEVAACLRWLAGLNRVEA
jgi:hypothetical protein